MAAKDEWGYGLGEGDVYQNAAIGVQSWNEGASVTFVADSNTLVDNTGTTADGIYIGDIPEFSPAGNITATITGNTISGWEHGIRLVSSVASGSTITGNNISNNLLPDSGIHIDPQVDPTNVAVHFNNISGNLVYGIYNGGAGALNATHNWWGDVSGPSGEGYGTGDAVSANVTYSPWLDAPYPYGEEIYFVGAKRGAVSDGILDATDEADTEVAVNGTATVTVGQYSDNPGAGFSGDIGKYIDVHIDSADSVTAIEIRLYYTDAEIAGLDESSLKLLWWNGEEWVECSDSGVNTTDVDDYSGYIWARITAESIPSLGDLVGTAFGGGGFPPAPPVVGGKAYPVNKLAILAPWIALSAAIIAATTVTMLRRRKPQS
jgi:parallel beta-helix repeat protein